MEILKYQAMNEDVAKAITKELITKYVECLQLGSCIIVLSTMHTVNIIASTTNLNGAHTIHPTQWDIDAFLNREINVEEFLQWTI